MICSINVSLRAMRKDGESIKREDYCKWLLMDKEKYPVEGFNKKFRAVVMDVCHFQHDEFIGENKWDEFNRTFQESLIHFSKYLRELSLEKLNQFRSTGVELDLFVSIWIDTEQFDLAFPSAFLLEAGKLHLPLVICSND